MAARKQTRKNAKKPPDMSAFLQRLEKHVAPSNVRKAVAMLKTSGFALYHDMDEIYLRGVVNSQADPTLIYACRIEAYGTHACCTQNLNICGGLHRSICKHLLVLIIGLVQAGELDAATMDEWVSNSYDIKANLKKEAMAEVFLKYKKAEAGEVDWRPTETLPEDYYAL